MSKRLFVGNLSFNVSEQQLQEAFAEYGSTAAVIPKRDDGRPKGFGFVDVAPEQASAAIQAWNGKELDGRTIAVDEAKPQFGDSGGGFRQGGGGRGGPRRGGGDRGGDRGGGGGGGGYGRRW